MEVRDTAVAPRGFVFVSEQRLLEPVRPTTVVVNNTTIINQTVNITKVQVVNQTVINEGPRPEVIERKSGRKVEAVPVRELRRREETEVVAKQRNIPTRSGKTDQRPPIAESTPGRTIPGREVNRSQQPATVPARVQPSTGKNETRGTGAADSPNKLERNGREIPARKEPGQESKSINARPDSNPAATASEGKSQARPGAPVPARGTAQTARPSGTANRPQFPVVGNGNRSVGEVKSSERPAQQATEKQMGHERQRALGRGSEKTGAQNPAQVRKPAQPPATRPALKPKPSGKPAVKERSSPKAKKDGEQETPQPANPPGQPRQPN
jgi:hypothetical protein